MCNRSWHLPGNPKPVFHPACLIKEAGCVDLSMNTMHIKDPLVVLGYEGSIPPLPHFLISSRIIMLCLTITKYYFLVISHGTKWPLCDDVSLKPDSPTHSQYRSNREQ